MALAALPRSVERIRQAARSQVQTLALGQLLRSTSADVNHLQSTARWLQRQLPIRLARRVEDFWQLPHAVVSNPSINEVLSSYVETFEAVSTHPEILTEDDERSFLELIVEQSARHHPGTRLVAEGYRDVRLMYPDLRLDKFLHDHFTTRIATRILMDNYILMRDPKEGFVGVVRQGIRPLEIVKESVSEISNLTRMIYGVAPEVEYRGNHDCVLDYIPRHVKYMVREILKNAFRATVDRHLARGNGPLPPIVVEFQQGDAHAIIKISDHGGGMSKQLQELAWQYGWTTAERDTTLNEALQYAEESCSWDRSAEETVGENSGGKAGRAPRSQLAGYGFGLPLTRLHAQYFGGDVFMQALPGHGVDMYLILTHLKAGSGSTELDDFSTVLYTTENRSNSSEAP
eukprot:TRINITY_DN42058_c0_g1_i1.p1 TRINITY_DN42058_c0_g1~~TRINITY_DN42058_c0_g1_i1.p1  ORF type:complete len:421 (+),score=78.34 TRINITY_DN42058_c0_g1_i1:59-1264(+)